MAEQCPTTIAALHAAYEDTWAALGRHEETASKTTDHAVKYRSDGAIQLLAKDSDNLQAAILRRYPANEADLLILATHACLVGDRLSTFQDVDARNVEGLNVALSTIVAYVARSVAPGMAGEQIEQTIALCAEQADALHVKAAA